jgi:hypothetical protein
MIKKYLNNWLLFYSIITTITLFTVKITNTYVLIGTLMLGPIMLLTIIIYKYKGRSRKKSV